MAGTACYRFTSIAFIQRRCIGGAAGSRRGGVGAVYVPPDFLAPAFARTLSSSHPSSIREERQRHGFFDSTSSGKSARRHVCGSSSPRSARNHETPSALQYMDVDKVIEHSRALLASSRSETQRYHRCIELIRNLVGAKEQLSEASDDWSSLPQNASSSHEVTPEHASLALQLLCDLDWQQQQLPSEKDGQEALQLGFLAVQRIASHQLDNRHRCPSDKVLSDALQKVLSLVRANSPFAPAIDAWVQLLRSLVQARRDTADVKMIWLAARETSVGSAVARREKFLRELIELRFMDGALAICDDLPLDSFSLQESLERIASDEASVEVDTAVDKVIPLFLLLRGLCLNNMAHKTQARGACEALVAIMDFPDHKPSPCWGAVILYTALTRGYGAAKQLTQLKVTEGKVARVDTLAQSLLQGWYHAEQRRLGFIDHDQIVKVIADIEAITGVSADRPIWVAALKVALRAIPSLETVDEEPYVPTPGELHEAHLLYKYALSRGQRPVSALILPLLEAHGKAYLPDLDTMFDLYTDVASLDTHQSGAVDDPVNAAIYVTLLQACAQQRDMPRAKSLLYSMAQLAQEDVGTAARLSVRARSDIVFKLVRAASSFQDAWTMYVSVRDLVQPSGRDGDRREERLMWEHALDDEERAAQHAGARPSAGARLRSLVAASQGWAARTFGSHSSTDAGTTKRRLHTRDLIPFHEANWQKFVDLFGNLRLPLFASPAGEGSSDIVGCPPRIILFLLRDAARFSGPPTCKTYTIVLTALTRLCWAPIQGAGGVLQSGYDAIGRTRQAVFETVTQLHAILRADRTLQPDLALINALMRAYSHCRANKEVVELWSALRSHAENEFRTHSEGQATVASVDGYTLGTILDFCSYAGAGYERLGREAWEWAGTFAPLAKTKGAHDSYAELLCRRGRREEAVGFVFDTMRRSRGVDTVDVRVGPDSLTPSADIKTLEMLLKFASRWDERDGGGGWWEVVRGRVQKEMPELWKDVQEVGKAGRRLKR